MAATGDVLAQQAPTAIITGPDDIAVGRTLVLDASSSIGLGENTTYAWYRDNFLISRTVEAVYTPERPGTTTIRVVITTTIGEEKVTIESEKTIIVYERKMVLIADNTVEPERLEIHRESAAEQGIFLRILQPRSSEDVPLSDGETMMKLIKEQ